MKIFISDEKNIEKHRPYVYPLTSSTTPVGSFHTPVPLNAPLFS